MLLAVPAIMLMAASSEPALRSGIFCSAIFATCSLVIFATFVLLGTPEPLSMPQAFFRRTAAGGVFVMKENERSAYTVITTGMIRPMSFFVRSLKSFVNATMFTPC